MLGSLAILKLQQKHAKNKVYSRNDIISESDRKKACHLCEKFCKNLKDLSEIPIDARRNTFYRFV